MSMKELASALQHRPAERVLVDELESRGFVRRQPHPTDRRAQFVVATRKGKSLARTANDILASPPPPLAGARRRGPRHAATYPRTDRPRTQQRPWPPTPRMPSPTAAVGERRADDCFAQADVAEPTIELATKASSAASARRNSFGTKRTRRPGGVAKSPRRSSASATYG